MTLVFAIQLIVLELFNRIKIFNFFAYFVRQVQAIIVDALPLSSMLGVIVLTQTLLFWLLAMNAQSDTDAKKYSGINGFFECLTDSYRLAYGDFDFAENFTSGNEEQVFYTFVFWFIFFIGSLISMLIILNMVIAVMTGTYTRIEADTEAHISRAKLQAITKNYHRIGDWRKKEFASKRYMLIVDVDPEVDLIEKESEEKRLKDRIGVIERTIGTMKKHLSVNAMNLNVIYDRLGQSLKKQEEEAMEIEAKVADER